MKHRRFCAFTFAYLASLQRLFYPVNVYGIGNDANRPSPMR
ncbi:MAG: hypothetical protein ACI9JL_002007 [Paracoccaceae bacterium]|jgi:hypothetical protein